MDLNHKCFLPIAYIKIKTLRIECQYVFMLYNLIKKIQSFAKILVPFINYKHQLTDIIKHK